LSAANLAKFRKVQHDLEQAEERAEAAENAMAKMRTTSRNSVSASRVRCKKISVYPSTGGEFFSIF